MKIKVISGRSFGVESPVKPLGGCWFFHITFSKKSVIFHKVRAVTSPLHISLTHEFSCR